MHLSASAACSQSKRAPTSGLTWPRSIRRSIAAPTSRLKSRLRHRVGAPAGADHLGVAEQQSVDSHLGDRAAGEADDDDAAALAQRAQAVGEAVAADRVEHQVDAAAGELLRLVLPGAVGAHDVVGAGLVRDARLRLGRDDGDRPRAEPARDLQRGGADAAGGAVHEHPLALGDPPARLQREVRGVVVEDEAGALGEVERVRQLEGEEGRRDGHLRERAERGEGGDAVARPQAAVGRRAAHDAAGLAAGHERQRRSELVLAARLQHLGERHPCGAHVDDDGRLAVQGERVDRRGLGHLDVAQRAVGPAQLGDLDRAHARNLVGCALRARRLSGRTVSCRSTRLSA